MPRVTNKALQKSIEVSDKRKSSGTAAGILVGAIGETSFKDDSLLVPARRIPLEQITEREINDFELVNIPQLAESIEQYGLIDPISVIHRSGEGTVYTIVSGHRRFKAYQMLNNSNPHDERFESIPSCVYELTDDPTELSQGLPYIDSELEQAMYVDANMQSRQLTYGEVAHQIKHIIARLEDDEYYKRLNTILNDSTRYSVTKGDRVKMIMDLLSSYSYRGWQRETIRRYLKLYEAVKEQRIPAEVLENIESEKMSVKLAYEKYLSKTSAKNTPVTKSLRNLKRNIDEISRQNVILSRDEKHDILEMIEKLQKIVSKE